MSRLVYSGSKSLTARVLGRVKGQLQVFIAPATTFSLLAFSALAKCYHLRVLNLDYVIERIDTVQLLRTVGKLTRLEALSLRIGWVAPIDLPKFKDDLGFPPSLRRLTISGVWEPEAAKILHKALERSKIDTLSIMIGGGMRRELTRAIHNMNLKSLRLDIAIRPTSPDWQTIVSSAVPDLLHYCRKVEELSIPLIFLSNMIFTNLGALSEPPYAMRKLIIHPSPIELTEPMLQDYLWDQMIINILSGYLQHLAEITVLSRTDVLKFVELDREVPGRLDELDQALFDEDLERSGLFLTGHREFS